MSKTYRCDCGDWSGEPCQWTGESKDMVVVRWTPNQHRASHTAAGNSGSSPGNGAMQAAVERSCADLMVETDGVWAEIIAEDAAAVEATATVSVEADTAHTLEMWDDAATPRLMDYHTGEDIRAATAEEIDASADAGPEGVILLADDGAILQEDEAGADEARRVYVQTND